MGKLAAAAKLPLLKHSNQLRAASPRPSYTSPVAHLPPAMAVCVSRDKSSLSTQGLSPPVCLIASQRGKQEMPRARLCALPPAFCPPPRGSPQALQPVPPSRAADK